MNKIKQELKKLLTCYLDEWLGEGEYDRANTEDIVDDILNPKVFPHIAVVDREAELPYNPFAHYTAIDYPMMGGVGKLDIPEIYLEAQQDMTQDGWVKEIK